MIASIRGELIYKDSVSVTVECAGVGYRVFVTNDFLCSSLAIGDEVRLFTHFQLREDGCSLFGFTTMDEKKLFEQLLNVSGVGPKGAMSIISYMGPVNLRTAIITGDAKSISKSQGIGIKTAQKIILELKDKVDLADNLTAPTPSVAARNTFSQNMNDAILALSALGYDDGAAVTAVKGIDGVDNMSVDDILKAALKRI